MRLTGVPLAFPYGFPRRKGDELGFHAEMALHADRDSEGCSNPCVSLWFPERFYGIPLLSNEGLQSIIGAFFSAAQPF